MPNSIHHYRRSNFFKLQKSNKSCKPGTWVLSKDLTRGLIWDFVLLQKSEILIALRKIKWLCTPITKWAIFKHAVLHWTADTIFYFIWLQNSVNMQFVYKESLHNFRWFFILSKWVLPIHVKKINLSETKEIR